MQENKSKAVEQMWTCRTHKFVHICQQETLARTCGRGNFFVPQEQRSYSSFSRSQQQRGAASVFGSRNVTGGSALPQDSSDYSGNSIREENVPRRTASVGGESRSQGNFNAVLEGRQRSLKQTDQPRGRSSSHKFGSRAEPRVRNESNLHLTIGETNLQSQNETKQDPKPEETSDESQRWHQNSNKSKNNVVAMRNNRINSTTRQRSTDHRRNIYEPVTLDTHIVRRKKWWRFFKWIPNAKAFGFRNERTRYTSPSHSIINDIENNPEAYSLTACYTTNAQTERPV